MAAAKGKANVKESMTPQALQGLINKRFGEGTMIMASDPSLVIERLPCGILSQDAQLGGGFARNRHAEIYGSANVGKTYMALHLVMTTQQAGGRCAWVDVERTFDPKFAKRLGINLEELALHRQEHGPMCVNFIESLLRSGLYDVIVLDSIASLLPQYEYENEMGAGSMGMEQAKLMSTALRKLTAANSKTAMIFINQTRDAVGGSVFGPKSTTSGGRSMAFYAGVRIELTLTERLKRKGRQVNPKTGEINDAADVVYGHRIMSKVTKDKTGGIIRPQDESTFVFDYERGRHDHIEDLIYLGRRYDFIEKKGDKWWVEGYDDEQQHGRPRFKKWLSKNRAVQEELEEMIVQTIVADVDDPEEGEDD